MFACCKLLEIRWLTSPASGLNSVFVKILYSSIFQDYDIIGFSVMSPQASDAYLIIQIINKLYPEREK